ncbi:MAG: phage adaptor protein [Methylobacter sp.]
MVSTTDAKTILDKASLLASDVTATHWTVAELLGWLNDGQLEIATLVPNSNAITATIHLSAGAKQSAPTDSIRIIEFTRNRGISGTSNGNAIRAINRKKLDAYMPNWAFSSPNMNVVHSMYNAEDDNQTFYVYPPQPATPGYIEIIYAQMPVIIANANVGTKITIEDFYANALLDYVLYRAFGKDSEYGNQATRSAEHYKMFAQAIGAKFGADHDSNNDKSTK